MSDSPSRRFSDDLFIDLKSKVDQIYEMLVGDGTSDAPGIMVRLDRLEQAEVNREKKSERAWQGRLALWGAVATILMERIWDHLHR